MAQLPTKESKILKTVCTGLAKCFEDYDIDAIEKVFFQKSDMQAKFLFIKLKLNIIKDRWELIEYILDSLNTYSDDKIIIHLQHKLESWVTSNSPNRIFTKYDKIILNLIIYIR